jgi:hypothetical protein
MDVVLYVCMYVYGLGLEGRKGSMGKRGVPFDHEATLSCSRLDERAQAVRSNLVAETYVLIYVF